MEKLYRKGIIFAMDATREEFDQYVCRAIAGIDPEFRHYLDEVPVIVEDLPEESLCAKMKLPNRFCLLGVFQGLPINLHKAGQPVPCQITLFRRNILTHCRTRDALIEQIRKTLVHELGHYLGFSEDELRRYHY